MDDVMEFAKKTLKDAFEDIGFELMYHAEDREDPGVVADFKSKLKAMVADLIDKL